MKRIVMILELKIAIAVLMNNMIRVWFKFQLEKMTW